MLLLSRDRLGTEVGGELIMDFSESAEMNPRREIEGEREVKRQERAERQERMEGVLMRREAGPLPPISSQYPAG